MRASPGTSMRRNRLGMLLALPALAATIANAAPALMQAMRGKERVVLAFAPAVSDPRIALQRRILADWRQGAADRDVVLVTVAGSQVAGTSDSAGSLRQRYRPAQGKFEVLLIGKDGHVAMRSPQPITGQSLEGAIDAMPMRRNGGR